MEGKHFIFMILAIEAGTAVMIGALLTATSGPAVGLGTAALVLILPFILIPAVMVLFSRLGGWRQMAARFPAREPLPDATRNRLASIAVGKKWCRYNNVVQWSTDSDSLHLSLPPFFNAGHPPMSIPWAAVESIERAGTGMVKLAIGDHGIWAPIAVARAEMALRESMYAVGDQTPDAAPPQT